MLYIEVLLLAIGLSMDSLAVSVTGGAVLKNNCTAGNIIKIASVLGIFQAGMTVIWLYDGIRIRKIHLRLRSLDRIYPLALLRWKNDIR